MMFNMWTLITTWTLYEHHLVILFTGLLCLEEIDASMRTNVLTPSCSPDDRLCVLPTVNIETQLSMALYNRKTTRAKRVFVKDGKLFTKDNCTSKDLNPVPDNETDSINAVDGTFRYITTLNGEFPGPSFVVYENQEIVVNFTNNLIQEGSSIHFHGVVQKCTNFMDGVPGINQCAFNPGETFTYRFTANPVGTHFYHSHYGFQRIDGLSGTFIVLPKPETPPTPEPTYEQELLMTVQDFFPVDGNRMYTSLQQGLESYLYEGCLGFAGLTLDNSPVGQYAFYSALVNGRGRRYNDGCQSIEDVPMEVYTVQPNKYYKFRLINAATQFAFKISIDNHPITVVGTEISPIQPVTADSIMVFLAERYEFYIYTNQTVGNYWIRIETIEKDVHHFTRAVLRYSNAKVEDPITSPKPCTPNDKCKIFNCPYQLKYDNIVCSNVGEWKALTNTTITNDTVDVNETLFFYLTEDNRGNHKAAINDILFEQPTVPPSVLGRTHYDRPCTGKEIHCTQQKNIPLNATVQYLLYANGFNHPIHTHGFWFQVLKVGYAEMFRNNTRSGINEDLARVGSKVTFKNPSWAGNNIPGLNLVNPVLKDTIALPTQGYVLIRFVANNPGWWFMHCHIDSHLAEGMALIQQVGNTFQMVPPPQTMHLCGNIRKTDLAVRRKFHTKLRKLHKKPKKNIRKFDVAAFRFARRVDQCPAK